MKLFGASLLLNLRRLIRKPSTIAVLLLLPLLILAMGLFLPASGGENTILAGVLIPEDSPKAEEFMRRLEANSTGQQAFVRARDAAEVERMVAGGLWECGYIAADNFEEQLKNNKTKGLFICVVSPASTLPSALHWSVLASLLDIQAPAIAAQYLAESSILPASEQHKLDDLWEMYFVEGQEMKLDFRLVSGTPIPQGGSAQLTGALLARGFTALMLFLFSWLCAVRFAEDLASGFFTRLKPYTSPAALYFSAYTSSMLLSALAGSLSLALGSRLFPGWFGGLLTEGTSLVAYLILLGAYSFILSVFVPGRDTLIAALPFVMIASLLLSPVLVDVSAYFPPAGYAALLLPPTYYLRAVNGSTSAIWLMLLLSVLLAAAGLLAQKLRSARKVAV